VANTPLRLGAYEFWHQNQQIVPGETLPERLGNLERLGYHLIQLARGTFVGDYSAVKSALRASPIAVAVASVGGPSVLAASPEERAAGVSALKRSLHVAAEVGAIGAPVNRQHALPNLEPLWSANDLARALLVHQLKAVAPLCRDLGVCVLIEPLNRYESEFIQTLAEAAAICQEVGGGAVKILADFYHMNLEEADVERAVVDAGPHIGFVHIADSNRCEPGTGHADFRPLFRGLKRIGYEGYVSLECQVLAEDKYQMLARVRALLEDIWEQC
jgi:sugar phosphate isomerase/epimerase